MSSENSRNSYDSIASIATIKSLDQLLNVTHEVLFRFVAAHVLSESLLTLDSLSFIIPYSPIVVPQSHFVLSFLLLFNSDSHVFFLLDLHELFPKNDCLISGDSLTLLNLVQFDLFDQSVNFSHVIEHPLGIRFLSFLSLI